jgi:acyl carrier protein
MPKILQESEIVNFLIKTAGEIMETDLSEVTFDTALGSLGMDSLDQLELVTALEDQLSIRIPDEQMRELATVGRLVACVMELQLTQSRLTPS